MYWLILWSCTGAPPLGVGTTSVDTGGFWAGYAPAKGGIEVRSGVAGLPLATVHAPGEWCGDHPPLVLVDYNSDGVPEVVLPCREPGTDGITEHDLYLLDGAELLAGRFAPVTTLRVSSGGVTALGDLDGDGLPELGLGIAVKAPLTDWWWSIVPGSNVQSGGNPARVDLLGEATQYGSGPPHPIPDVDGDGVNDLVVWQTPGGSPPVVSLVSGSAAMSGLSVVDDAIARFSGLDEDRTVADVATVNDLNGDGRPELALAVVDRTQRGPEGQVPTVLIATSEDLAATGGALRIRSQWDGKLRDSRVEDLGDLDGDGLRELAVLLTTFTSSEEFTAELAVLPGAALIGAISELDPTPWLLGGVEGRQPTWLVACDLDGDGLPELVMDTATWDGRDLLTPGAVPIGPGAQHASCAGDLDGLPGSELLVGRPDLL